MQDKKKLKLLKAYATLAKSLGIYPTIAELNEAGVTRNTFRFYFGTHSQYRDQAKKAFPDLFKNVLDDSMFNNSVHDALQKEVRTIKRFVITTAIAGAPVHKGLLASIKTFCKERSAMLMIIPADYALQNISKELATDPDVRIVFKTLSLNSNICINPIKIDPKQVDPATGLDSFGQSETVIIGSPKQRRVPVATANGKFARVIQATGAITRPNYIPRDGIPKRRDTLAERHHRMGGVIVEIVDNKLYHFRHFEMAKDGSFNDVAGTAEFINYSGEGTKPATVAAIVQGDSHVGETNKIVSDAVDEICRLSKPDYRVSHDFFNGASLSHHNMYNQIERAIMAKDNRISVEREIRITAAELVRIRELKTAKVHVIVESNHNMWIGQYLNKGFFTDENRHISVKLQDLAMQGKHPLRAAMEDICGVKPGNDIRWLGANDEFRLAGVELAAHGHLGSNGRRNPGIKGMYNAFGKVFFGHVHHGEVFHDAMSVGTSTHLTLSYNSGASNWDNAQGILYADGTRQLINIIKGKWRL